MQANWFRIGNFVQSKDAPNASHSVITSISDYPKEPEKIGFECGFDHSIDCYKPIPLTEEWLLKFGFSKSVRENYNDMYKDLSARMVLWFNEGNIAEMDLIQDEKHISFKHGHIQFVHQLQNLYFALTGEELILKG